MNVRLFESVSCHAKWDHYLLTMTMISQSDCIAKVLLNRGPVGEEMCLSCSSFMLTFILETVFLFSKYEHLERIKLSVRNLAFLALICWIERAATQEAAVDPLTLKRAVIDFMV